MNFASNIAQVSLDGDLDVRSVPDVRRWIDDLVDSGCRRIVVNMAKAAHVDSSGLGLILREMRRMRELGGLISFTNVSERVYQTLALMRMLDFVPISRAGLGDVRQVPELPPGALPEWRTTFRVDAEQMASARARLEELLEELPLPDDDVFDMTLASGEAVGNAVDHTEGAGVLVTVAAYEDRVVVDVADRGEGFEPPAGEGAEVDAFAERGRGIHLMRLLADSVTILPKSTGEGTVVRLVKLFSKDACNVGRSPV